MYICANCKRFIENIYTCHECKCNVCDQCIIVLENKDDIAYKCAWTTQLCSDCQCAGECIKVKPYQLNVGYNKCISCKLQYCNECYRTHPCKE